MLTMEQWELFDEFHCYLDHNQNQPNHPLNHPIFLEGKPGHGKSFLIQDTAASFHANGLLLLIVGTTALAVHQYEHGHTAHHTFHIPVNEVRFYFSLFHLSH